MDTHISKIDFCKKNVKIQDYKILRILEKLRLVHVTVKPRKEGETRL